VCAAGKSPFSSLIKAVRKGEGKEREKEKRGGEKKRPRMCLVATPINRVFVPIREKKRKKKRKKKWELRPLHFREKQLLFWTEQGKREKVGPRAKPRGGAEPRILGTGGKKKKKGKKTPVLDVIIGEFVMLPINDSVKGRRKGGEGKKGGEKDLASRDNKLLRLGSERTIWFFEGIDRDPVKKGKREKKKGRRRGGAKCKRLSGVRSLGDPIRQDTIR